MIDCKSSIRWFRTILVITSNRVNSHRAMTNAQVEALHQHLAADYWLIQVTIKWVIRWRFRFGWKSRYSTSIRIAKLPITRRSSEELLRHWGQRTIKDKTSWHALTSRQSILSFRILRVREEVPRLIRKNRKRINRLVGLDKIHLEATRKSNQQHQEQAIHSGRRRCEVLHQHVGWEAGEAQDSQLHPWEEVDLRSRQLCHRCLRPH